MLKLFLVLFALNFLANTQTPCEPFGLRIYYGDIISDSTSKQKAEIYFNTKSLCNKSHIRLITKKGLDIIQCFSNQIKTSQNMGNYIAYVQKCSLQRISFGQTFSYTAFGWGNGGSLLPVPNAQKNIEVKLLDPTSKDEDVNLAIFADWSPLNTGLALMTPILDSLKKVVVEKRINTIVINGDIAYDLDSNSGINYVNFLNYITQISSKTPIIHISGNHQHGTADDELLFSSSFKQYGINQKLTSGLTIGSLYLLPFDPYKVVYGKTQTISSLQAFKIQLQEAVKSERFILPLSHYPLLCSGEFSQCDSNRIILNPFFDSMLQSGVTLYVGAHTHSYERNYPYLKSHQFAIVEGPYQANEQYIVSIVEGIAGNEKGILYSMPQVQKQTAKYSVNSTGFGVISSKQQYVSYSHFSTSQGFMDQVKIYKENISEKTNSIKIENQ